MKKKTNMLHLFSGFLLGVFSGSFIIPIIITIYFDHDLPNLEKLNPVFLAAITIALFYCVLSSLVQINKKIETIENKINSNNQKEE